MTILIKRTYNVHGEHDFLIRMDGAQPVWTGDARQALLMTTGEANACLIKIENYRDWLCPNGIDGVSLVCLDK